MASARLGGTWVRRHRPGLAISIADGDEMYHGAAALTYFAVGADALSLVRQSLLLAGCREPLSILDLPSGHGRVLRWIRAEWPEAEITACDLNVAAVDWCVRHLAVKGIYSSADIEDVDLGGPHDLIWCGSLFTHLDKDKWDSMLTVMKCSLRPGGALVFTTHGQEHRERLRTITSGLGEQACRQLIEGYETSGFGYHDYPERNDYGVSLARPNWVADCVSMIGGLDRLALWIAGWNHHQDVHAYRRSEVG